MGFEHRKSIRIKADFPLCFWAGEQENGPGAWGRVVNLSDSGLAFSAERDLPRGTVLLLELGLPDRGRPLQVLGQVLRSEAAEEPGRRLMRVLFTGMDGESLSRLEQHVLQGSDPKVAAATGWGKAYFQDQRHYPAQYRELPPGLADKWLEERSYLASKGLVYLKAFQGYLESYLGERIPGPFKILGSRGLLEKRIAWVRLKLPEGRLHLLAEALWEQREPGERAIVGLHCRAFHKDEALRIEKGERSTD